MKCLIGNVIWFVIVNVCAPEDLTSASVLAAITRPPKKIN